MDRSLREFRIRGVKTNIPFLENVVNHERCAERAASQPPSAAGFNNILKHARAKNISLTLYYNNEQVDITVADDGVGFIISRGQEKYQQRLLPAYAICRKRAELLKRSLPY